MKKGLIIILIAILTFGGIIILTKTSAFKWQRFLWLKSKTSIQQTQTHDSDGDGKNEDYILQNGKIKILQNGQTLWQSPPEWWVDSFAVADSDNNSQQELNLSVWKIGSFGPIKPFWFIGKDDGISNHFFVFRLVRGDFNPVWQSSALTRPNCSFEFKTQNNQTLLYTREGQYTSDYSCTPLSESIWEWNGWGFAKK
ncbi:MAG: hypothetical protein WC794_01270 [Candidatus Doudnabacteria bacterium]|jgi:hypothetical protein